MLSALNPAITKKPFLEKNWNQYFLALITITFFPLLPLLFEFLVRGEPSYQTILVVAAVYSVTIGVMAESNPLLAIIALILCVFFSFDYALTIISKGEIISRFETILRQDVAPFSILFWAISASILLYKAYVVEGGRNFWGHRAAY